MCNWNGIVCESGIETNGKKGNEGNYSNRQDSRVKTAEINRYEMMGIYGNEKLTNNHISSFGSQGDGHGLCEDFDTSGKGLSPIITKGNFLVR